MMSKKKTLALSLLVMMLWGSLFPMIKLGYKAFDIVTLGDIFLFAGMRFVVCGFVISIITAVKDKKSYVDAKNSIVSILFAGFFAIILHYSFTYSAMQITDSSKTAILKQVGALFYVCFSFLFFKNDKVTIGKIVSAVLGFGGIVAINATSDGVSFNIGDVLILAASFSSVAYSIISKKVSQKVAPLTVTGISQVFGGIVLLAMGIVFGGKMNFTLSSIPVFAYICFASTLSYCLWAIILKTGELSKLLIIKFAEPAFACIFGALILGENVFNVQYISAFILICSGIYISNRK